MTAEELEKLIDEISGELEKLTDDPEKPLAYKERRHRSVLRARKAALERAKAAMEEGNVNKETQASLDYGLLTEYGEKHPLLFNLVKSQIGFWLRW
jgi:tRNA U34 5-carboxymethylaminomethyl modifying GTPase MnmE/TrmE